MVEVRWENLRPRDMERRVNECPVVYVPFGSLEWHGFHNPLGLDTLKAYALCLRAAERGGGIVAPATFWPVDGMPHPWTVRMSEELIYKLAVAIYEQMAHVGFKVVIALTGHYGIQQLLPIKKSALEVMYRSGLSIYAIPEYEVVGFDGYRGDHAAKCETSLAQALFPELVDLSEAEPEEKPMDGVGGMDPRIHASAEWGEKMANLISERLVVVADRLLKRTSPRERSRFIEASASYYHLLEKYRGEFQNKIRNGSDVYWQGLDAIWKGNYQEAIDAFIAVDKDIKENNP